MRHSAQASLEYIFMFVLALVVIYLALKEFIDPRTGTIRKEGQFVNATIDRVKTSLDSILSSEP